MPQLVNISPESADVAVELVPQPKPPPCDEMPSSVADLKRNWRKRKSEYERLRCAKHRIDPKWRAQKNAVAKAWRLGRRAKELQRAKDYRKRNSEKLKAQRKSNRDKKRLYDIAYYEKHKSVILARVLKHQRDHPDLAKRRSYRYRETHPEWAIAYGRMASAKRRARKRGAFVDDPRVDGVIRSWRMRATFVCYYCKNKFTVKKLTVDHIIPISKGGKHTVENICKACAHCNYSKGNKPIDQFCSNGQKLLM